jgi:SAM-dependent methyltransferase
MMETKDELAMEEDLFRFYMMLRTPIPEGGAEWNLSPEYHYLFGFAVKDFIRRHYKLSKDTLVCNVGIGVGEWDDYLGYWLRDQGNLTSVDINTDICERFAYRQRRERHPNPSRVVNEDIFKTTLAPDSFDLVTIIGSTPQETGNPLYALNRCFELVKPGGTVMYMGIVDPVADDWFERYLQSTPFVVRQKQRFDYYPEMIYVAYLVSKPGCER